MFEHNQPQQSASNMSIRYIKEWYVALHRLDKSCTLAPCRLCAEARTRGLFTYGPVLNEHTNDGVNKHTKDGVAKHPNGVDCNSRKKSSPKSSPTRRSGRNSSWYSSSRRGRLILTLRRRRQKQRSFCRNSPRKYYIKKCYRRKKIKFCGKNGEILSHSDPLKKKSVGKQIQPSIETQAQPKQSDPTVVYTETTFKHVERAEPNPTSLKRVLNEDQLPCISPLRKLPKRTSPANTTIVTTSMENTRLNFTLANSGTLPSFRSVLMEESDDSTNGSVNGDLQSAINKEVKKDFSNNNHVMHTPTEKNSSSTGHVTHKPAVTSPLWTKYIKQKAPLTSTVSTSRVKDKPAINIPVSSGHVIGTTVISNPVSTSLVTDTIAIANSVSSSHVTDTVAITTPVSSSHDTDTTVIASPVSTSHAINKPAKSDSLWASFMKQKRLTTSRAVDKSGIPNLLSTNHVTHEQPVSFPVSANHVMHIPPITSAIVASHAIHKRPITSPVVASHAMHKSPITRPVSTSHVMKKPLTSTPVSISHVMHTPAMYSLLSNSHVTENPSTTAPAAKSHVMHHLCTSSPVSTNALTSPVSSSHIMHTQAITAPLSTRSNLPCATATTECDYGQSRNVSFNLPRNKAPISSPPFPYRLLESIPLTDEPCVLTSSVVRSSSVASMSIRCSSQSSRSLFTHPRHAAIHKSSASSRISDPISIMTTCNVTHEHPYSMSVNSSAGEYSIAHRHGLSTLLSASTACSFNIVSSASKSAAGNSLFSSSATRSASEVTLVPNCSAARTCAIGVSIPSSGTTVQPPYNTSSSNIVAARLPCSLGRGHSNVIGRPSNYSVFLIPKPHTRAQKAKQLDRKRSEHSARTIDNVVVTRNPQVIPTTSTKSTDVFNVRPPNRRYECRRKFTG